MTTYLRHSPEVVRRWHAIAQGVAPATPMSWLPLLLDSAAKLAEDLDQSAQPRRRGRLHPPSQRAVHPPNKASLSEELRELCVALRWVRDHRTDLPRERRKNIPVGPVVIAVPVPSTGIPSGTCAATTYEGPLAYLEAKLVQLLQERLATARIVLEHPETTEPLGSPTVEPMDAVEPTLLDFPPPAHGGQLAAKL
jgi:hypothetical protein